MENEYKIISINLENKTEIVEVATLIYKVFLEKNRKDSSEKLRNIYKRYYGEEFIYERTREKFRKTPIFLGIKDKNKIVGVIRGSKEKIVNIYVDTQYQGLGIGKKLLQSFEESAKKSGSNKLLLKSSKYAYDFYIKNNFIPIDTAYLQKNI